MQQKSIFTLLFALGLNAYAWSQPIMQTNVLPDIGDQVTLVTADTINANPGPAGANKTWNFANWHPEAGTTPQIEQYVAPAGTPYANQFNGATIVGKVLDDTITYAYYKEQASSFTYLGSGSLAYLQTYTDQDVQLKFPLNYNNSFPEAFAYITDANSGFPFYSKGARNLTYDAYGTLTTPLGTFQNAMRYKGVSSQIDSASFSGLEIVNHTNITTYGWLVAGYPNALAVIYYIDYVSETRIPGFDTIVTVVPVQRSASYASSATVGAYEQAKGVEGISGISLGPVPATDQITLRFECSRPNATLKIGISDVLGRELQVETLETATGLTEWQTPVNHLPAGQYYLTMSDGKGLVVQKWIKQ